MEDARRVAAAAVLALCAFACAERGAAHDGSGAPALEGEPRLERVLAPKSEPKSDPKVESEDGTSRPLDKWLPERTAENPVLKRAYEGRVWIDPRGGGGLFVTTLGQPLVLVGLDAELAAAHGRRVRLDGTVWTCGGVWRGSANKLTPLDDSPPAQSPGDTRPPPIPIVRTREDLERVFAPWVLVTGTIAGHWEREGSDDGDGSDGATLRLDDGFEFEVVDLPNKVLRRVVQGDRVSASVRLADLEQRARGRSTALFEGTYSVELVALCVGDRERCAAADVRYYKPTLWQLKCRLASQRRASAPPYQPPPAPRSRPLPSVACQQYARDPPPGCEGR